MWDSFSWSVAARQLRYGISQSLLTIGVVGISVTLIIFLSSLIGGLQRQLISTVTGALPHIVVSQPERMPIAAWQTPMENEVMYIGRRPRLEQRTTTIEDWMVWQTRIPRLNPQIIAVSPVAEGQGIIARGANQRSIVITGVIPERYNQVVDIETDIVTGRFIGLLPGEVSIGSTLADDIGVEHGEKVRITTAEGISATYRVAGIYDTGYPMVDRNTVFVALRDGQSILGLGNAVTSITLKTDELFASERIAVQLSRQVPYDVTSWMEENQALLTALNSQTASSRLIIAFAVVAAGFGIASILITAVASKQREIGILRAIGATRKQIIGLFTLESVLLATIGAIVGAGAGVGFSIFVSRARIIRAPGEDEAFPIDLSPELVLGAMGIAIIIGFLASLYPAVKASKIEPIEVIRGT